MELAVRVIIVISAVGSAALLTIAVFHVGAALLRSVQGRHVAYVFAFLRRHVAYVFAFLFIALVVAASNEGQRIRKSSSSPGSYQSDDYCWGKAQELSRACKDVCNGDLRCVGECIASSPTPSGCQ